jgi:hypothetical protein
LKIYGGDDLFCHEPFCRELDALGLGFILVCKPDSHPTPCEWLDDLQRHGAVGTVTRTRWTGRYRETDTYRYAESIPLRDADNENCWIRVLCISRRSRPMYPFGSDKGNGNT